MQTTTYKLNITPGGIPLTIHISQYDVGLREYTFEPYTNVGEFTYVPGANATLEATKPDGYAVIHNCGYNQDGTITYTIQEQLAAKPGRVWSKVVLRYGTDVLGTGAIVWIVDNAGVKDSAIVSDSDISGIRGMIDTEVKRNLATEMVSLLPESNASGAIAHFIDGADDIPVKDLKIGIVPKQSGSGDPSPSNIRPITGWMGATVTRVGKNLLPKYVINPSVYNNVVFTVNADGSVKAVGKASATCNAGNQITGLDGEFILTGCPAGGSASTYQIWIFDVTQNSATGITDTGNGSTGTLIGDHTYNIRIRIQSGYTIDQTFYPMLRPASIADSTYEPYTAQTYPISWEAEAGTIYGGTLDVTTGVLTVTDGYIAVYAGESLPSTWISDRDVYASGTTPTTGAQVVYKLSTPATYQLTPTEIRTLLGSNNIWADTGDVDVTYKADTQMYIDKKITVTKSIIAGVETEYKATKNYTTGQFLIVEDNLYKATANIANGATIAVGTNVVSTTVAEQLIALANA